jgi:isopenicillin N synthase-like dioxygenase
MNSLPILDLSSGDSAANAELLGRTCETIGFFMLRGHEVSPALQQRVRTVSKAFFDLPAAEKQKVAAAPGMGRGYRGFNIGALAHSAGKAAPPDLRESFLVGPPDCPQGVAPEGCFAPNIWPVKPAELEPAVVDYYRAMADLAARTLDLAALALGLPQKYFRTFINQSVSQLQVINYPEQAEPPLETQLRASAHTDFGTLTFLLAEDKPGGLQVQRPDATWLDVVPPEPDVYIVNIGDLMARWTNDRWRSTVHRVVNPPRDAGAAARRTSVVFFHHPNEHAVISCLPNCSTTHRPALYPPTTAGQHMRAKIAAVYSKVPLAV